MFEKLFNFICGFVVGAAAAAVAVSLTTPENGEKIREEIRNGIDEIKLDYEMGRQKKREDLEAEIRRRWGEDEL